jgi:exodeoxyribonuclease V alpha subunit
MDLPICTREIVYTAITRARRSALIVATEDSLRRALSKINRRHSGVADRLNGLRADR